ncbi:hypothetical protein [Saccharopolyspora sp. NPDC002686]|uniref:hypothetical protein n=1 Tax=Saccharopolyspora sp. NPDC002686 TaxID=3154541 RepID=UPI0033298F7D
MMSAIVEPAIRIFVLLGPAGSVEGACAGAALSAIGAPSRLRSGWREIAIPARAAANLLLVAAYTLRDNDVRNSRCPAECASFSSVPAAVQGLSRKNLAFSSRVESFHA